MSLADQNEKPALEKRQWFATTHWSVVLAAGQSASPQAEAALEKLCRIYWYPLYAYVRRRGHSPHDAQDLTQGFFARLLEKNWVGAADREKGRFRSFLLSLLNHYLGDERARSLASAAHWTIGLAAIALTALHVWLGRRSAHDPARS